MEWAAKKKLGWRLLELAVLFNVCVFVLTSYGLSTGDFYEGNSFMAKYYAISWQLVAAVLTAMYFVTAALYWWICKCADKQALHGGAFSHAVAHLDVFLLPVLLAFFFAADFCHDVVVLLGYEDLIFIHVLNFLCLLNA